MKKISNEQDFHALITMPQITVAVFKTTWCPDCHYIEPFMPDLEKKYDQISFIELDRDELPELCEQLNILGIPSFLAFREGQELARFVNKLRKTREEIEEFLEKAIEVSGAHHR
jgi:thiol-disulfide isomerase/thioredoxin